MPSRKQSGDTPPAGFISATTRAAMPGVTEREKGEHPEVWLNGKHYAWKPGETDGIPEEALVIWQRAQEANA